MAQGVDPRIKLAQAVSEKSPEQQKGLKSMFDVLNQWHAGSGEKKEYKKMLTFQELTGIEYHPEKENQNRFVTETGENVDLFAYFGFSTGQVEEHKAEKAEDETKKAEEMELFQLFSDREETEDQAVVDEKDIEPYVQNKVSAEEKAKENDDAMDSFLGLFGAKPGFGGLVSHNSKPKKAAKGGMKSLFHF